MLDIYEFPDGIWKMTTSKDAETETERENLGRIFKSLDGDISGNPSSEEIQAIRAEG